MALNMILKDYKRELEEARPNDGDYKSPSHDLFCFMQKVAARVGVGDDKANWYEAQERILKWASPYTGSYDSLAEIVDKSTNALAFQLRAKNSTSFHNWVRAQGTIADSVIGYSSHSVGA